MGKAVDLAILTCCEMVKATRSIWPVCWWVVLLGERNPDVPAKHRELAALVRQAIHDLTPELR
jgi:hypothetical protein